MSALYHLGFGSDDLDDGTTIALLSGDPARSEAIAENHLSGSRVLARNRGLDAFAARLPDDSPVVCATGGMGGPSTSIVVNELAQAGIRTIIRIGTSGSISQNVNTGSVVVASAALTNHGSARDIAPVGYPAAADPFLTVALASVATDLGVEHHVGVVASTDTFYEGQERRESANPALLRRHDGMIDEYESIGVLGFEMETGTLFTMGGVYGLRTAAVLAIVAQRHRSESVDSDAKNSAVDAAVRVAVDTATGWHHR